MEAEWGLHITTGALQPPSVMLSESQRSTANIDVASSSTVPTHGDFFNSLVNDIGQLESFQPQPAAALDDERICKRFLHVPQVVVEVNITYTFVQILPYGLH